ncbi:MAG: hydrogenase nickel incorporation protein HypB [Methylomonas sp.]|jgi:hydrogenase nickel incorporation protein HypB|uniref:hydrogenase nickel incorporation protein HypB n=1 Tax=Methylomonas sp. TaxID=418 RepID=UPI0025D24688|nr:hydrogenase nickel incorporation protein HypB [Methylomonas sp.]MCK9607437.1 hydrogenase nickel incorporation protein HypB [Methylomonas sp.]
MCGICGCGEGLTHSHDEQHEHDHSHDHHHHDHDHSHGAEHAHAPGLTQARMVQIEQDILAKNNRYADENRHYFSQRGMLALNLVSSPGSGKTTLLTETISRLKEEYAIGVIEGDQQTARDADRIRATGVPALQINTGKGCHLDAHRVGHALESLNLPNHSLLFIENVGNLVCPSAFDLGEAHKVVILSVTEGEDKPIKYPDMFHAADLMILNKTDLLPYLDFDSAECIRYAKQVNPRIKVLSLSAKTGEGMESWLKWLRAELELQRIEYA